jgi:hypothetical protein
MYGIMWLLDMRFDTRFFAVASCMLGHLEYSLLEFGKGMGDLVNYLAAAKRIQVSFHISYWMNLKEIVDFRQLQTKNIY